MVKINGELLDVAGKTIASFLDGTDYNVGRVAVELNGEIVSKTKFGEVVLSDGDVVEVVSFVGGG